MTYELFLFDLDDTLLDFRASEELSFALVLEQFGYRDRLATLYPTYREANHMLWMQYERREVTKDFLRVERFRRMAQAHGLQLDADAWSDAYLALLPGTVVLNEYAAELCTELSARGEIGIITNGIHDVQLKRIANSALAPHISFVCVSDTCGYAKPDVRFFEHSSTMAKRFDKRSTLVIGDRLDADILGAHHFGVDSCWFNPHKQPRPEQFTARYEIAHLSHLPQLLSSVRLATA